MEEDHIIRQMFDISKNLGLNFYSWTVTGGLKVGLNKNSFYNSNASVSMLKLCGDIISENMAESVFAIVDFDKHLKNNVTLRLFKDQMMKAKNSRTTFALLGINPRFPDEVRCYSAEIEGGYPSEAQIIKEINSVKSEFKKTPADIRTAVDEKTLRKMLVLFKGLSFQQIRRIVTMCLVDDGKFDASDIF